MNHSQLRAFHAVASEGSFTGAANMLRVSQPTLSAHVRLLEEGYGIELFERKGRSIQLTEFGRSLKEITTRYFAVEAEAETLLARAIDLLKGRLRVAADSPFYMIPLLSAFSRRYPAVQQSLTFGNSEKVLHDLLAGNCDIAFIPEIEPDARIFAMPFYRDRLVTMVAHSHPLAQSKRVRLAELAEQTVLLRERGSTTRALFERTLEEAGITLKETMELGSREAIREAVAGGLGVGIVNAGEVGRDDRLQTLSIRDANLNLTEFIACLDSRKATPEISALFEIASEMKQL